MAELSKILNKLYEDLALEKISEERYQAMAPDYEREQILLREKREKLTAEIVQSEEIYENVEKFLPVIWKYTNLTELTAHVLNELIEKIVVHEKVVATDEARASRWISTISSLDVSTKSAPLSVMPHRKKLHFRNIHYPLLRPPENESGEPLLCGPPKFSFYRWGSRRHGSRSS